MAPPTVTFFNFNTMDMDASGGEGWAQNNTGLLTSPVHGQGGPSTAFHPPSPVTLPPILPDPFQTSSDITPAVAPSYATSVVAGVSQAQPGRSGQHRRPIGTAAATTLQVSSAEKAPKKPSPREKKRDEVHNELLMFRNPLSIATIVVHGREFLVHADLLCRHGAYFRRALRGGFAEAQTQRIVLDGDDVTADDFGMWVDLLYRWHFHTPGTFVLRKEELGGTLSTKQILALWRLSDRFLHEPLAALVEESLHHRLDLYTAEQWRKLYRTRSAHDIRARVNRLQEAYRLCTDGGLPFGDELVAACANCPPQVYADCVDLMDTEFMALVSRRMILQHADDKLLPRDHNAERPGTAAGGAAAEGAEAAALVSANAAADAAAPAAQPRAHPAVELN